MTQICDLEILRSALNDRRSGFSVANSGVTLIGIIAAIVIMGLLGAGVLMLVLTGSMESIQTLNWGQAFFAAESGVSAARAYMATNVSWKTHSTNITGVVGQASFSAILDTNGVITSVGSKDEAQWTSMWRPTWAMLVYGTSADAGTPKYKLWGGTNWSAPSDALKVGTRNINWVVVKACPKRDEYIAATIDANNRVVKAQVYRDGSWGNLQTIATNPTANNRGMDIAYETLSGDAMVVAANGTAKPTYYVWNGATWTGPGTVNISRTGIARWIKLAADPVSNSNEIIVMVQDAGANYTAQVWNGSNTWGNELLCTGRSVNVAYEAMDVEYETSGHQGIIVNNSGVANKGRFNWCSWTGLAWSAQSTNNALGDYFRFGALVNDPNSDKLLFTYVDNDSDVGKVFWTGSNWTAYLEPELTLVGNSAVDRCVEGQFETISGHTGHALIPYSDLTNGYSRHATDPSGASWDTAVRVSTITDSATVQARRTGDGKILAVFFDDVNNLYDFSWYNGANWSAKETLENAPSVSASPYKEPFMMAPKLWGLP